MDVKQATQSVVPEPSVTGSSLEMHILRSHPKSTNSEFLRVSPSIVF